MNRRNSALSMIFWAVVVSGMVACGDQPVANDKERDKPIVIQLKGAKGKIVPMEFVACPAGQFEMGNSGDPKSPSFRHEVTLTRKFWIGKFQVTREQWATVYPLKPDKGDGLLLGGEKRPIDGVSAAWVSGFCDVLMRRYRARIKGFPKDYVIRLPTEAEWECALRANCEDETDPYVKLFNGDMSGAKEIAVDRKGRTAFFCKNGGKHDIGSYGAPFIQVGTKKPNAWGIYDMLGNGAELTLDTIDQLDWVPVWNCANESKNMSPSFAYEEEEKDPLRIAEDKKYACSIARNIQGGNCDVWVPSPFKKTRVKYDRGSGFVTVRLVIGPNLVKEHNKDKIKKAAAAKKRVPDKK